MTATGEEEVVAEEEDATLEQQGILYCKVLLEDRREFAAAVPTLCCPPKAIFSYTHSALIKLCLGLFLFRDIFGLS